MEEKLSVLEALGALKGFVSGRQWRIINGTKPKPNPTRKTNAKVNVSERTNIVSQQNIEEEWSEVYLSNSEEVDRIEGIREQVDGEMEVIKSEADIPEDEKPFQFANHPNSKEKTDETDNLKFQSSLIIVSESEEPDLNQKIFTTFDESESSEGESHNAENIPSSVQEWVNHLPSKHRSSRANTDVRDESNPPAEDVSLIATRLSREASVQSNSSLDSLLDSRRPDPVEIFLNLGFGGVPGVNMENCRIPKRFLVPSKCKGGDWNEFLKRELRQAQNFECSSLGFRGLSGPSYRRPSAIVANIMEKLRERSVAPSHPRSRFSAVAKRVLDEKSVLNKLTPEFQSVLSPDNRKFLQNQGKKSPEVPRRRIIFGQKSFAFAHDGEFIEVESSGDDRESPKDNPAVPTSDGEEPPVFPNPEVLLKLRRSSLQKQKKVDEDTEDVFCIERPPESDATFSPSKEKAGKIPKRFISSSNLKGLEKEVDTSEVMRLEVEKEIRTLSHQIKSISHQDLACVLEQVKQLRSRLENTKQDSC